MRRTRDPRAVPSPLIGKPAPAFSFPTIGAPDKLFAAQSLRGRVWLLNVWASWCTACRHEHSVLIDLAKTGAVPIYGLNYKDGRKQALDWLSRLGNPYVESFSDDQGLVGIVFGVSGVPATFVINQACCIRHQYCGPLKPEPLLDTPIPLLRTS